MRKNMLMIILLSLIFVFTSCGNVAPIDSIEYTNAPITVEESTTSKPDETSSIIETEAPIVWHDPVKLGEKYTAKSINAKESAKLMGYQEDTYEFTYMEALSGISFYLRLAEHDIENIDSDTWDHYISRYYETVNKNRFLKPYPDILFHGQKILSYADFTAFPWDLSTVLAYWKSSEYILLPEEFQAGIGLSFDKIADQLQYYTNILLELSKNFPDYAGEFMITDEIEKEIKSLYDACIPVLEERENLFSTWKTFYNENCPVLHITEEFDKKNNALKIVLDGNGKYIAGLRGEYIENYQFSIASGQGGTNIVEPLPMKAPITIYIPVVELSKGLDHFDVKKIDSYGRTYEETVIVQTDCTASYSAEPLHMKNEFLHLALTEYFGGEYTERDLLEIQGLYMYYGLNDEKQNRLPNKIVIQKLNYGEKGTEKTYTYDMFFNIKLEEMPDTIPVETLDDCKYFHALVGFNLIDNNNIKRKADLLRDYLSPYYVTENTWSKYLR